MDSSIRSPFITGIRDLTGLALVMPITRENLARSSKLRRVSVERSSMRDQLRHSHSASLPERLSASLEHHHAAGEARWSARASLALILGVGVVFWVTVYLLSFA